MKSIIIDGNEIPENEAAEIILGLKGELSFFGGFLAPFGKDQRPSYLVCSKVFCTHFAGKTIADVANEIGNYGQNK